MDITTSEGLPVAMAAVRDLLNTLSALDYFMIINSPLSDNNGELQLKLTIFILLLKYQLQSSPWQPSLTGNKL